MPEQPDIDPFSRLQLERERTLFMFYGYRNVDGTQGRGYFKLAHSLSQALADLQANAGVANEGGYFVTDAFLELDEGSPVIHVELISAQQIADAITGGGDG